MFPIPVPAAQIVNVEYIHKYIAKKWNIDIPYHPQLASVKQAANTEYLLGMVDITNRKLNGEQTTDYLSGEYATHQAADTIAANRAIETLIRPKYKFFFTPATDNTTYSFNIGAAGIFAIDWGDGTVQIINKPDTGATDITHTFPTPASGYRVSLGGHATGYAGTAISFYDGTETQNASGIKSMSGCLGCIFHSLNTNGAVGTRQPGFGKTFYENRELTQIPDTLFDNISGDSPAGMFSSTFQNTAITSIPPNLFAGLHTLATSIFSNTFAGCTQLTNIPPELFANIDSTPRGYMFYRTFHKSGITEIPDGLFDGIRGQPANFMFAETFTNTKITKIPDGLFAGIQGPPASNMFFNTFARTDITKIPPDLFAGISGKPAANMFDETFIDTKITEIPPNLFAGIDGPPANGMYLATFSGTQITSIPPNVFGKIKGDAAAQMYMWTFRGTPITSIPEDLFGDIGGAPQSQMFYSTFWDCTQLQGPSARFHGEYLYNLWPDVTGAEVGGCYKDATGLTDYKSIPRVWVDHPLNTDP